MRKLFRLAYQIIPLFLFLILACSRQPVKKRILVFSLTKGWHHNSIPAGNAFFQKIGKEKGFIVDTTTNPRRFQDEYLKNYDLVVFLNTTGNVLNRAQEVAFERYIQAGGSWMGIHSATDTEYEWPWYGQLAGAYFQNHPEIQKARIFKAEAEDHSILNKVPNEFSLEDEWYNFIPGSISKKITPLLFLDEDSYSGGKNGKKHPAAWFQEFDGGKAFYTVLGHKDETYQNRVFIQLIGNALDWTLDHKEINYKNARTESIPDEDRFMKTTLAYNLDEPMELAIEPDGNVWVVGRKGQIWLWNKESENFGLRQTLSVWTKFEDGLLGITLDRNFKDNHWAYLFYSPNIDESVQHVSRFTIQGDSFDFNSEKILLKIPVQRLECCHSGGSLTMDSQGHLWISTGDNTNPHKSDGFAPIDERENRGPFDAQKSSANANDLRGKVLRIKPETDGTYSIPDGNLFPKGMAMTRSEIYVMGCRNPFRISVNENGTGLAWGDVGPDSGKDSIYGPKGHDEINLTYKPGFFGWPYFIANNIPYTDRNFSDSVPSGPQRNPAVAPINNSPRNTGISKLPLPQPAWIYYPYIKTDSFPEFGKGGRTAMAGPWIPKNGGNLKLPPYYFGKMLVYDWMRGWVFAVSPNPESKPVLERILTRFEFSKPMDMELGSDGCLYVLEYGTNWFSTNIDARLSRIEYSNDNHSPVAELKADHVIGGAPLTVHFSAKGSFDDDPDDSLAYEWRIQSASKVDSRKKETDFTFHASGIYTVRLVVTDRLGKSSATSTQIKVGNYPPVIQLKINGNSSFYWPGVPVDYETNVSDKEDGSTEKGTIPLKDIVVYSDVLKQTEDQTTQSQGHQSQSVESAGKALIAGSDCKSCHQEKVRSAGPSYQEIANRYRGKPSSLGILAAKVLRGGAGNWGDHAMSAHPQISLEDSRKMVAYVLAIQAQAGSQSMGAKGRVVPGDLKEGEILLLSATYKDKGAPGIESIDGKSTLTLRYPKLNAQSCDFEKDAYRKNNYGKAPFFMRFVKDKAFIAFKDLDLAMVNSVRFYGLATGDILLSLECCLDSLNGPVIGRVLFETGKNPLDFKLHSMPIKKTSGKHTVFFVSRGVGFPKKGCDLALEWISFER